MSENENGDGSELLQQVAALQQQLQQLQATGGEGGGTRVKPVKNVKMPAGTYAMSPSDFRTYAKDIQDFQSLTLHTDSQIIMEMRLNMDVDLKRSIDINYGTQWDTFNVQAALSAVKKNVVLGTSNTAVFQKEFDNMVQNSDEVVQEFVTRLRTCASDCSFVCPYDDAHDLTDYHLITRLRSGVANETLKQELLQKHEALNSVESIVTYCETFESAVRDKQKLSSSESPLSVGHVSAQFGLPEDEVVSAVSQYKRQKKNSMRGKQNNKSEVPSASACSGCGYTHEGSACKAIGKVCLSCGKPNHFARVCLAEKPCAKCGKKGHTENKCTVDALINSAIVIGSILKVLAISKTIDGATLPKISVTVGDGFVMVVADTGAMVTVAGPTFLRRLQLDKNELLRPTSILKHVGGGKITVLGYCNIAMKHNGVEIIEPVFFVLGLDMVFLSLNACKEFRLVHRSFPHVDVQNIPPCVAEDKHEQEDTIGMITAAVESKDDIASVSNELSLPDRPETTPYPAIDDNIELLEKWLLQAFSSTTFNVDARPLPAMSGPPCHIHLEDNPVKYVAHTPIPVAHYHKPDVNAQNDEDVLKGVLRKVPPGEPVDWCQRMIVLPKHDGSPRRVVDFQPLNKFIKRETHLSPTPFEAVSSVPPHMYKTKTDAYNGYHQVPLDVESQKLTTFITENGRYQYLRAPQGLSLSGDAYVHRYDDIIRDVKRKVKIIDDSLLYDIGIKEAFFHTFDYLCLCAENGVTLNPKKFEFCRKDLDFCGFHLSWDGFRPSDDTISSIRKFPMPEKPTVTDIRAWYGLVNHVAPFLVTTELMKPFRELQNGTNKVVYWDEYLQSAFERSRDEICKLIEIGLTCFRKDRETALVTDYSDDGLGFILLQKTCQCVLTDPFCCVDGWKLILCGSRTLHKAEDGYEPREGEALAIAWSIKKCRMFLLGHPGFMVFTDHKSLVKTFNDQELRKIDNPRILKMKEKCLMYKFVTKHIEGKKNCAPDTLSRYPLKVCRSDMDEEDEADLMEREISVRAVICGVLNQKEIIAIDIDELLRVSLMDPTYVKLIQKIRCNTFCKTSSLEDPEIRPYFNVRDRLNICDNLIMYTFEDHTPRLLIPDIATWCT